MIDVWIRSTDGDFPGSTSGGWRVVVDADLKLLHKEPVEDMRLSSGVGFVEGKRIHADDPRFTDYLDGCVHKILDYGAFELVVWENAAGAYERQPPTVSSIWYYTETVCAAYDKKDDLLWKTAVDFLPDFDM